MNMELKLTDNLSNSTGKISAENAKLFIGVGYKVIDELVKLDNLLVPEKEYKGELVDGVEFDYHQLYIIEEEILSSLDVEEVGMLYRLAAKFLIANGHNTLRIKMSMNSLSTLITMLEDIVDNYLPMTEEEVLEIKDIVSSILRNTIFPYLRELGIIDTVRKLKEGTGTAEVNVHLHEYFTVRGMNTLTELEKLNHLLTVYPVILPPLEVAPEIWDDFVGNVPSDYIGNILDLAEQVTVEDIASFNQGKLVIDDEYIQTLNKRAVKSALNDMND